MCWNIEVSLITGVISYTIAAYLWFRNFKNDRWHAIFLATFSTIQFLEAFIWHKKVQIKNNTTDLNSYLLKLVVTILIPLVLALEPVSVLYGAQYKNINIDKTDIILYGIVFLVIFALLVKNNSYPNVIQNNSIKYSQQEENIFFNFILALLILYPCVKYTNFNLFYGLVYFVCFASIILAYISSKQNISSHWCLYGNLLGGLCLFYPYLL